MTQASDFTATFVGLSITFRPYDTVRPNRPVQTVTVLEYLPDAVISTTERGPALRVKIEYLNKNNSFVAIERILTIGRFGDYLANAVQQEGQHEPIVKPIKEEKVEEVKAAEDTAAEPAEPTKKGKKNKKNTEPVAEEVLAEEPTEDVDQYLDMLAEAEA